jgi:hypothetical protein
MRMGASGAAAASILHGLVASVEEIGDQAAEESLRLTSPTGGNRYLPTTK